MRIRQSLDANGYAIRRSTAEMTAARSLVSVSNNPEYRNRRARLMSELRGSMTDATILETFRAMSEAERVQFIRDYNAERDAMASTEDPLPPIRDVFENALELGDETTGLRLIDAAIETEIAGPLISRRPSQASPLSSPATAVSAKAWAEAAAGRDASRRDAGAVRRGSARRGWAWRCMRSREAQEAWTARKARHHF